MIKSLIKSNTLYYILLIIAATLVFFGIYGVGALDPSDIHTYYLKGDWTQHYFGWVGFRISDWRFPLGLYDNNTYPDETSIIFTDSIPIVAVICKALRGILPETFQYFGIFTLVCYIAQALVGGRIFRRFTDNKLYSFIAALILLFLPIQLHRTFVHEALGAQFILLLMIETLLRVKELSAARLYIRIFVIALLSAGVHMYYVLMCGIVLVGICVYKFLDKMYIQAIIALLLYIGASALFVWIEGGFSSDINTSDGGSFELFGANLNTLYNSCGKSAFLPELPLHTWTERDAMGYLGLGVIFACLVALCLAIISRSVMREWLRTNGKLIISIIVPIIIAAGFAILPVITINDKLLLSVQLPDIIRTLIASFRCHGRTIWIVTYFLTIIPPIIIYRTFPERSRVAAYIIIVLVLLLQVADMNQFLRYKYEFVTKLTDESRLFSEDDEIEKLLDVDTISNVVINKSLIPTAVSEDLASDIYVWAISNHKSVNYIYLARDDARYDARLADALYNPKDDYLYVFREDEEDICAEHGLDYIKSGPYIFARRVIR